MTDPAPGLLDKALAMLPLVARAGTCSLAQVAGELLLPLSTVHRLAQDLTRHGYLIRLGRGRYRLGPALLSLAAGCRLEDMLVDVARPVVTDLARDCRACVHLGSFDGEMVTYLVKRTFGREKVFSAEGMQLEAYCSGIGKVLLAHLPPADLSRYLSTDGFVPLTPRTITEPARLAAELEQVRRQGWALDDEEILTGLRCVAVPVPDAGGGVCAALSVSAGVQRMPMERVQSLLPILQQAADRIRARLFAGG